MTSYEDAETDTRRSARRGAQNRLDSRVIAPPTAGTLRDPRLVKRLPGKLLSYGAPGEIRTPDPQIVVWRSYVYGAFRSFPTLRCVPIFLGFHISPDFRRALPFPKQGLPAAYRK